MGKIRVLVFVLFIALGLLPLTARAAEELFDSKGATEHIEKGITKLKAGNYDAAITEFEEAASISPDAEAEAYYYLGYTYYIKGKTHDGDSRKKSLEYFQSAYEINPNFTPSRFKPVLPQEQQPEAATAPAAPEAAPAAPAAEPAAPPAPAEPAPAAEKPAAK